MFDDILHSKRGFSININVIFKKSKNFIFSKGLVLGFGQKYENFPSFLFYAK